MAKIISHNTIKSLELLAERGKSLEYFEALKKYLSSFISIPPTEWIFFIRHLSVRRLEKDELFCRQGEYSHEIGFVIKGLLYNFYTDAGGETSVNYFVAEGGLVGPYSSLLRGIPASFSSKAIEPCVLVILKYKDLQELYKRHICWERMGRISAEKIYIEKEKRELEFQNSDARSRYEVFMKENSALAERVPQYLIASYLGVSAVSLSRIRKNR